MIRRLLLTSLLLASATAANIHANPGHTEFKKAGGVRKITAGSGISISPTNGRGNVTITATGGVGGGVSLNIRLNNNADAGNISTMTIHVANGLSWRVGSSSGTLSIATTAQMTISSMTTTGTQTSLGGFIGDCSSCTRINPSNILAGALGTSVMASSVGASGVTPGSYTNANITIGGDGRITSASNGTAGGGGGSAPRIFVNGADSGVNASTFTFHVSNGLSAQVSPSSVTISLATTGQVTIDQITVTTITLGTAKLRTFAGNVWQLDVNGNGSPDFECTPSSCSIFPAGTAVKVSTGDFTAQDEGSSLGKGHIMDFVGAGVTATMAGGIYTITIPGGSGSMQSGATYYVQTSSNPQSPFVTNTFGARITTFTAISSFTAVDQTTGRGLITPQSLDVDYSTRLAGGLVIISTDPNSPTKFSVAQPESTNGVYPNAVTFQSNVQMNSSATVVVEFPFYVLPTTAATAFAYSSHTFNGRAVQDGFQSASGTVNSTIYTASIPSDLVAGTTAEIDSATDLSTGTQSQQRTYLVSFATASRNAVPHNLVYTSTIAVTITETTGAGGGTASTFTNIPINTGLCNILGTGDLDLYVRIVRDGDNTTSDPSTVPSAFKSLKIKFWFLKRL